MTITSTQFQQNVGHYLGLAEQGMEVTIIRKKPRKALFTLHIKKPAKANTSPQKYKKILQAVHAHNALNNNQEDGTAFQQRVRQ